MAKMEAKYIPIGAPIESVIPGAHKTIQEIEAQFSTPNNYQPIGGGNTDNNLDIKVNEQRNVDETLHSFVSENIDMFAKELDDYTKQLEREIQTGKIRLKLTNADINLASIDKACDRVVDDLISQISYQVHADQQINYQAELVGLTKRYDTLDMKLDYEKYATELKIVELENKHMRKNRYSKREIEGVDELGVIKSDTPLSKSVDEKVERREFVQNYEGSDLDNVNHQRDKLEQQILQGKKKSKIGRKTETEKIEEEKARLRKKQAKRNQKLEKQNSKVNEIDTVGVALDLESLRNDQMERLMEIKELSAKKKEMQLAKEKQRSKATKEFYKYKKVNKQSHIVGFKQ